MKVSRLSRRITIAGTANTNYELDEIRKRLINQNTNKDFLLMNIATHIPLSDYTYFLSNRKEASNLLQLLVAYILIAIPAAYMQLLLGQYTRLGFFFMGKMIPLAQGISFMASLHIIFTSVIYTLYMEMVFIYALISLTPTGIPWMKCHLEYKDNCWEIDETCKERCVVQDKVFLAAYLYWNVTYMSQTLPIEKARIALPDITRLWASVFTWLVIYLLTIVNMVKLKKVCKYVVALLITSKVLLTFSLLIMEGLVHTINESISNAMESSLSYNAWVHAVRRATYVVGLGDLSNMMFGVLSTDVTRGGTMAFVNGMCLFLIETLDFLVIETSSLSLMERAGIEDQILLFSPKTAEMDVGFIPSLLGKFSAGPLWTLLYFLSRYISTLFSVVIAIRILQTAIYQRFPRLFDYYKYVAPTFCGSCFFINCCLESKEAHEIYQDLRYTTENFCGLIIGFMLSTFVVFFYGLKRFSEDIHFMTGQPPTKYWKITWYLLPLLLLMTLPFGYISYLHPLYVYRIGLIILFVGPYIICCSIEIFRKIVLKDPYALIQPNSVWGPISAQMRAQRILFNPNNDTRFQGAMYSCRHKCLLYNKGLNKIIVEEAGNETNLD